jgi:hypothetical protein
MYGMGGRGRLGVPRPKARAPVVERAGPFKGMRTTMQGSGDSAFAEWLHNCYPMNPFSGGELVVRPGRRPYPSLGTDDEVRHLVHGSGTSPLPFQTFQMLAVMPPTQNFTEHRLVAIVGGKFYATSLGSTGWSEVVTAAQLSSAGITLDDTFPYYAVAFNSKLVIVGREHAWTWDGTSGGGVVHLSNAGSSFYGRPVVYAAKVWFIKGNRREVIWSEEGDETTGYEAGGFNNAWDLRQTSGEQLVALLATNEALYFFRRTSIGAIYGGSAADFQTTSTLDAVSATVGCKFPDSPTLAAGAVWFHDQEGRPCYFDLGSTQVVPVWRELERAFTIYAQDQIGYDRLATPNSELASFFGVAPAFRYFRALDMVAMPATYINTILGQIGSYDVLVGFNATTKRAMTVWSFPTRFWDMVEVRDAYYGTGQNIITFFDEYGYTYAVIPHVFGSIEFNLANFDPSTWNTDHTDVDGTQDEGADVEEGRDVTATCIGPRHFQSRDAELRATRLDIEYLGWRSGATLGIRWMTPMGMVAGEGATRWEEVDHNAGGGETATPAVEVTLDGLAIEATDSVPPVPGHAEVGLDEIGRWIVFAFTWKGQASRARLVGWSVRAMVEGDQREAY